jgi:hypothetical protein
MKTEQIKLALIKSDPSQEMGSAVSTGTFYVIATPTLCGTSIGSMDENLPSLYATKTEATQENQEMFDEYLGDIQSGDRDEGDEWNGSVMECRWSYGDKMTLYMGSKLITTEKWRDMAGF